MIYRPRVPDNVNHQQVFDSDAQLKDFIECVDNFAETFFQGSNCDGKPIREESTELGEIIQLKGNQIPTRLVSLEYLFRRKDDVTMKRRIDPHKSVEEHDKINIGNGGNPRQISIGWTYSKEEKDKLSKILDQYHDVFAWGYEDSKNFRNGKFVHHIPLKSKATTFKKKLRNYNPKLCEAIFKGVENILKA